MRWLLPNATMSNMSPGRRLSRIRSPATRTCAIESPLIDPEQSTTILRLRAAALSSPVSAGRKLASTTHSAASRASNARGSAAAAPRASSTTSRSIAAGRAISITVW